MWSRWICCCLTLTLVVQGLTVAAERVAKHGHVHIASVADHAHDAGDDDDDDHDHGHDADPHHGEGHFHASIGHHEHDPHDNSVVIVEDADTASGLPMATVLKRLALDQEQLAAITVPPSARGAGDAPAVPTARAFPSFVADPLEPPPRLSLT